MRVISYIFSAFIVVVGLFSCKKVDDVIAQDVQGIDKSRTYTDSESENRIKEEIWYYYKYLSLWEDAIYPKNKDFELIDAPDYIRTNFTNYFQTGTDVLLYLMGLTHVNVSDYTPTTVFPGDNPLNFYNKIKRSDTKVKSNYDRYSFLDRGGFITGSVGSTEYRYSMGMSLIYIQNESNTNKYLYVASVDKHSPAYTAGIKRGAQILKLNDDPNIDYNTQSPIYFNKLESYLYSSTLRVEFKNIEDPAKVVNLVNMNVLTDVVYKDSVIVADGLRIGYLGFSSFLEKNAYVNNNGVSKTFLKRMQDIFNAFSAQHITELVVDLRYNGGGYVEMQEEIANLMAPSSASGQVMNTYKINKHLVDEGWDEAGEEFAPVYFSKKGSLNLPRVYFLVSEETASASELLINVLVPHMKVYLIGTYAMRDGKVVANNTYGKPVGFFATSIVTNSNKLYVTSFQMFNKDGYGDYFNGLLPDYHVWPYQNFYDFGDPRESLFAAAIAHMKTNTFPSTVARSVEGQYTFIPKDYTPVFGQVYYPMAIKKVKNSIRPFN